MHYLKYVDKQSADPRCKNYHIFSCNICGHESQIFHRTSEVDKSNRKCPNCGVTDDLNELEYYNIKKSEIECEIKKKQDELYAITSKIQILTLTKESDNVNISQTVQGSN